MEEIDNYGSDHRRWGASLANLREPLFSVLEAAEVRSVAEIGAYAGDLTRELADWVGPLGGSVVAIDPTPEPELVELSEQRAEIRLMRKTSHDALREVALPDAVIVDGDHNYYTVSEELRLIDEATQGEESPLMLFHDVGWPHGRRDTYFDIDRIPDDCRQPFARPAWLFPGVPGIVEGALPFKCAAEREGGSRNGVLTAIEDFMEGRPAFRLATVPPFFGLGILWRRSAPWAPAVAEVLEPWDRNPMLARLEANRVYQLGRVSMLRDRPARGEHLLRTMLDSSGFALADRLSWLRHGGRAVSWRERARQAIDDDAPA